MTILTPNIFLTLYDSTSPDNTTTFSVFRSAIAGIATSSNFYKIDTAYGLLDGRVDTLELYRGAIPVSATFSSPNNYVATVAAITAYTTGMTIILSLDVSSSGTTGLNISSIGIKYLSKVDETGTIVNLDGTELKQNRKYLFMYDSTQWIWVGATSADQISHEGASGDVVLVSANQDISTSTTPSFLISGAIDGATGKTTLADADEIAIIDSAAANVLKSTSITNLSNKMKVMDDGWIPSSATWTYSSIDSPTGVVNVNTDMYSTLQEGMRVSYVQSQALSAYWSFNTNSTADVGSFTMADVGTPTYTSGLFSNALTLDGATDGLSITDTATLKPTGAFTIGAWVKTAGTGFQFIFASSSQNTNVAGIQLRIDNSTNYLTMLNGSNTGTTANVDFGSVTAPLAINDNTWHYVVVAYRDNYAQIYIDGLLRGSGYLPTPVYATTNYVRIGCKSDTGTNVYFFNGQIDDLFIINGYALDERAVFDKFSAAGPQGTANIDITKMGIVTKIGTWSGSIQPITIYHGTDYMLANSTITSFRYSSAKVPFKFTVNPDKWSVIRASITNAQKTSPTAGTWYGGANALTTGSLPSMDIPIGLWAISGSGYMESTKAAALLLNMYAGVFPDNSNGDLYKENLASVAIGGASGTIYASSTFNILTRAELEAKTTYYMLIKTTTATAGSVTLYGANVKPSQIIARSLYL